MANLVGSGETGMRPSILLTIYKTNLKAKDNEKVVDVEQDKEVLDSADTISDERGDIG